MNKAVIGKNGISAEIVQHSKCKQGNEVVTFKLKYGLIIHAEMLRHRMLSRGVKSNRAIPMAKIRAEVLADPYVPVFFGANQAGMVASQEAPHANLLRKLWRGSRYIMCGVHWVAEKLNAHKEFGNRLLNPWQWCRETVTSTELANLYNLRIHGAAQRDAYEITKCMYEAHKASKPFIIDSGEWHVPYVDRARDIDGNLEYLDNDGASLGVAEALICSAARCARSSYDNHDKTSPVLATDTPLYDMLVNDNPKHASPVEHQATPIYSKIVVQRKDWQRGVTHMDINGIFWSGNFRNFVQHRQLLADHTCYKYEPK